MTVISVLLRPPVVVLWPFALFGHRLGRYRHTNTRGAQAAPVADVESTDKPGMGIDEGIVLFTFVVLAAALTCIVMAGNIYK